MVSDNLFTPKYNVTSPTFLLMILSETALSNNSEFWLKNNLSKLHLLHCYILINGVVDY